MTAFVGTSGYDYPEWSGRFYPKGLPKAKRLPFYASHFGACEINGTFYRKPTAAQVRGWAAQVPAAFRFALKAWQRITHQRRLRACGRDVAAFAKLAALLGDGLGPTLYQLPPNFKADLGLLREFLRRLPAGQRAAFEFRHDSWLNDGTYTALADAGAALCGVDAEEHAVPFLATAAFGYARLRRDAGYSPAALRKWARTIAQTWPEREVYVFFKHEDTASGPRYAGRLAQLLG
jgi:uncharacterized protein YecE (DUF72 family)